MYWDINKPLSYNALFNFIVGNRGSGKSYGAKKRAIQLFLNEGLQFAYIRRYKEEYKDSANTFFDDIVVNKEFPEHEFEVKGRKFYIDGKVAGHGFVLSTSGKKKSMSFPRIGFVIFDEFILDPNAVYDRYLPTEVATLLNLYETISRLRTVPIFFLANALSWTNPYFLYFDVEQPFNRAKIKRKGDVLVQLVESQDFIDVKNQTRFGQMIKGTQYGKHIVNNEFLRDNKNFIHKPYQKMRYFFTIKAGGEKFGVYMVDGQGVMYVSDNYNEGYKLVYTTVLDNHEPNTMLLKGSNSPPFKRLVTEFKRGNVRFKNIKCKNVIINALLHGR